MAIDSTLGVRSGLIKLMKADAALIALVPKASIYPQATQVVPPYPFIRMGSPIGVPIRASCTDGLEVTLAIHGFASGVTSGGVVTVPAEDDAARIGAAIAKACDGKAFVIPGGAAKVRWLGPQLLQDPEESQVFHTIQNFRVRCITG